VGGSFQRVAGVEHHDLAAVSTTTGKPVDWQPRVDRQVNAIELAGSRVYIGGYFGAAGGSLRNRIAALDATTGDATEWNPGMEGAFAGTGVIYSIAVDGPTVYVGGEFNAIGGQVRWHLAALSASGAGAATKWNPGASHPVGAVMVHAGRIYAGGAFVETGGVERQHLASYTPEGAVTSWDPSPNDTVTTLAAAGDAIWAGGVFNAANQVRRERVAILDADGVPTSWSARIGDDGVESMALSPDGATVYASGLFTKVNGTARPYLAALDTTTGALRPFAPTPNLFGWVRSIVSDGSTVYVGGSFTEIGGQKRDRIAALDAATGSARPFNPGADGDVRALALTGGRLYAGGDFTQIGGQARSHLAALSPSDGTPTSWRPDPDRAVRTIVPAGSTLYVGGSFHQIAGQARTGIASFGLSTHGLTGWSPQLGMSYMPDATSVAQIAPAGETIYAAGYFTDAGSSRRDGMAGLSAATGAPTAFAPWFYDARTEVVATADARVYAGGQFGQVAPRSGWAFARFTDPPAGPAVPQPSSIAIAAPASPPHGEDVAFQASGVAGPGTAVHLYAERDGTSCPANVLEARARPSMAELAQNQQHGDFLVPAAIPAKPGERWLACGFVSRGETAPVAVARATVEGPAGPAPPPPPPPDDPGGVPDDPGDPGDPDDPGDPGGDPGDPGDPGGDPGDPTSPGTQPPGPLPSSPGPSGGTAPTVAGPPAGATTDPDLPPRITLAARPSRVGVILRRGLAVSAACSEPCTLHLGLRVRVRARSGRRVWRVAGHSLARLDGGHPALLSLRPSASLVRKLRSYRTLTVAVTASASDTAGNATRARTPRLQVGR
jgi:urease beta subunit